MQHAIAQVTWRCRSCGSATPMSEHDCSSCGEPWSGAGAARLASLISNEGCAAVQNNVVQLNVGPWREACDDVEEAEAEAEARYARPRQPLAQRVFYTVMSMLGIAGLLVFCSFVAFLAVVLWRAFGR